MPCSRKWFERENGGKEEGNGFGREARRVGRSAHMKIPAGRCRLSVEGSTASDSYGDHSDRRMRIPCCKPGISLVQGDGVTSGACKSPQPPVRQKPHAKTRVIPI